MSITSSTQTALGSEDSATVSESAADTPVVWDSWALLQGRAEVLIRHGDAEYRLRLTRNDKLILLK